MKYKFFLTYSLISFLVPYFHASGALLKSKYKLMQTSASSVHGVVAEMREIHMDYRVLWRKRDSTATLSRGEHLGVPQPLSE